MNRLIKIFIGILIVLGSIDCSSLMAEIMVPNDYPTIQEAILASNNGDRIIVQPGTYFEQIDFSGKGITLESADPNDPKIVAATIIRGNNLKSVVTFSHGEGKNTLLDGFTIVNGGGRHGGGIFCFDSSPTISRCIIKNNMVTEGGGGIFCDTNSSPYITHCTIINNTASEGGGIYCLNNSSPQLSHCLIRGNKAYFGGGINCLFYSSPYILNCNIIENRTHPGGQGGGIYCSDYSSPLIRGSVINRNTANFSGGGICCLEFSSLTIINCLICKNYVDMVGGFGGGIDCARSTVTIINCTLNDNKRETENENERGISIKPSSTITISDSILWSNLPNPLLISSEDPNIYLSITYSCLAEPLMDINLVVDKGNIYGNPLFIESNIDDFHLKSNSPCIDSGNPYSRLYRDKDGAARPQDGDEDGITRGDIGAYEFKKDINVEIPLNQGWNLISFPINKLFYQQTKPPVFIPEGLTEVNLGSGAQESPLKEWLSNDANSPIRDLDYSDQAGDWQRIISFDATGAHIIDKDLPSFINTLHYLCLGYGYWIKMNKAGVLRLEGQPAPRDTVLSLQVGWNLIGYIPHDLSYGDLSLESVCPYINGHYRTEEHIAYCQVSQPVTDNFFGSIKGKYRRVVSFDFCSGGMIYDTNIIHSQNTLHYLGPKCGYWIKIENNQPIEFIFPGSCN